MSNQLCNHSLFKLWLIGRDVQKRTLYYIFVLPDEGHADETHQSLLTLFPLNMPYKLRPFQLIVWRVPWSSFLFDYQFTPFTKEHLLSTKMYYCNLSSTSLPPLATCKVLVPCFVSWNTISQKCSICTKSLFIWNVVHKFVYNPVCVHFSFANITHPPDKCGISRSWLNSVVIT